MVKCLNYHFVFFVILKNKTNISVRYTKQLGLYFESQKIACTIRHVNFLVMFVQSLCIFINFRC
jgi:hypothetical protein